MHVVIILCIIVLLFIFIDAYSREVLLPAWALKALVLVQVYTERQREINRNALRSIDFNET